MSESLPRYLCRHCLRALAIYTPACPYCAKEGSVFEEQVLAQLWAYEHRPRPTSGLIRKGSSYRSDPCTRISTGFPTVDKVFGGHPSTGNGIPIPAVIEVFGPPGIGKSSFLLTLADRIYKDVLYVMAEQDGDDLAQTAGWMGLEHFGDLDLVPTVWLDEVLAAMDESRARVWIVDSLMGLRQRDPGSGTMLPQTQYIVRDMALTLIQAARAYQRTIILVAHVIKSGEIAGLKEIEHMVDAVGDFDGNPHTEVRTFRFRKNRKGATQGVRAKLLFGEHGMHEAPLETNESKERDGGAPPPRKRVLEL